jgi:hypothetical protein
MPLRRDSVIARSAALSVLFSSAALQAASSDECISAHTEGQRLRREGHLLAAREKFVACADESCPALVRKDCSVFDGEVEAQIPTAVPSLTDARGNDVRGGTVSIDDASNTAALDGRAVSLDPGAHHFTFTAPAGEIVTLMVTIREGEKYRRVVAALARRETTPGWFPAPTLSYVLGGVGFAGLGSFTYFALSGKAKQSDLEQHCAPRCSQADVDAMRTRYLVGDISLAIGVVSLGVGTYFFFADPFGERAKGAREREARPRLRWAISGGPGAGVASVSGDF